MRGAVLACLAVLAWSSGAVARQQPAGVPQPTNVAGQVAVPSAPSEPRRFVTRRAGRFNGREVRYTATAGETFLRDAKGAPLASVFSFAYTEDAPADPTRRPVTFVWNGGPGSSSIWLHLGGFGPVRVVVPSDARSAGSPPYRTEPNTETVLDVTDLVFVDPVGTGFSRALGEHKDEESWGLDQDAASVAAFIREWLTEHRRWNSPRFLMGESFGTTRAAAVADQPAAGWGRGQRPGPDLPGARLPGVDTRGGEPRLVRDLPPHDGRDRLVPQAGDESAGAARRLPGRRAPLRDRRVRARAAPRHGARARRRVPPSSSASRTSPASTRGTSTVPTCACWAAGSSRNCSGTKGLRSAVPTPATPWTTSTTWPTAPQIDAASAAIGSAFTATLLQYLATDLGVSVPSAYKTASQEAGEKWKWRTVPEGRPYEPSYVNVGPRLGVAMRRNPSLRVLVASGYYDFATPFFDAELTFARYGIVRDRVRMTYYEAGHMMYVHEPSRQRLLADVRTFLTER